MSETGKSAAGTLEQYTIAAIPESERHGRPRDLFTIWFSSNIMPLTFVTGALAPVAFGLPFGAAILAVLLGISWARCSWRCTRRRVRGSACRR